MREHFLVTSEPHSGSRRLLFCSGLRGTVLAPLSPSPASGFWLLRGGVNRLLIWRSGLLVSNELELLASFDTASS